MDDDTNHEALVFLDLLESFNLIQHVDQPTHNNGHTLDLLITRLWGAIHDINVDFMISDHISTLCGLALGKPPPVVKKMTFRRYHEIDMDSFKNDIKESFASVQYDSVDSIVKLYNTGLRDILEFHAPLQSKIVVVRHHKKKISKLALDGKSKARKLERMWRKSKTDENRDKFTSQKRKYNALLDSEESSFLSSMIMEQSDNPKGMFRSLNYILNQKSPSPLPPTTSNQKLANDFVYFFDSKIKTIHSKLDAELQSSGLMRIEDQPRFTTKLTSFRVISWDLRYRTLREISL